MFRISKTTFFHLIFHPKLYSIHTIYFFSMNDESTSKRTIKIGAATFVIDKVPDNVSDDELKKSIIKKLIYEQQQKVMKEKQGFGVAS